MKARLFTAFAAASMMLCTAVAVLWVRSQRSIGSSGPTTGNSPVSTEPMIVN